MPTKYGFLTSEDVAERKKQLETTLKRKTRKIRNKAAELDETVKDIFRDYLGASGQRVWYTGPIVFEDGHICYWEFSSQVRVYLHIKKGIFEVELLSTHKLDQEEQLKRVLEDRTGIKVKAVGVDPRMNIYE